MHVLLSVFVGFFFFGGGVVQFQHAHSTLIKCHFKLGEKPKTSPKETQLRSVSIQTLLKKSKSRMIVKHGIVGKKESREFHSANHVTSALSRTGRILFAVVPCFYGNGKKEERDKARY